MGCGSGCGRRRWFSDDLILVFEAVTGSTIDSVLSSKLVFNFWVLQLVCRLEWSWGMTVDLRTSSRGVGIGCSVGAGARRAWVVG